MNSSLPNDAITIGTSEPSRPLELDMETLKQVSGGSVVINDPGWVVAPGAKPPSFTIGDPGW
jgi:hypothetical protein